MINAISHFTLYTTNEKYDFKAFKDLLSKEIEVYSFAILENYAGISFIKINTYEELPSDWEKSFTGRIFNESKEIRWIADGDLFQAWTIRDKEDPQGPYEKISRPYYLYGIWGNGKFSETTVYRANLQYPVQGNPQDRERAFVTVALYRQARPEKWTEEPAFITAFLNQPCVSAHRFVTLGFGRNNK